MAQAERKAGAQTSTVSSCSATECKHNENRDCTAGSIQVKMQGGNAVCGTYDPETPKARP